MFLAFLISAALAAGVWFLYPPASPAPFAFFLFKASRQHIEANWPVVCYLTFFPLVACLLPVPKRRSSSSYTVVQLLR